MSARFGRSRSRAVATTNRKVVSTSLEGSLVNDAKRKRSNPKLRVWKKASQSPTFSGIAAELAQAASGCLPVFPTRQPQRLVFGSQRWSRCLPCICRAAVLASSQQRLLQSCGSHKQRPTATLELSSAEGSAGWSFVSGLGNTFAAQKGRGSSLPPTS